MRLALIEDAWLRKGSEGEASPARTNDTKHLHRDRGDDGLITDADLRRAELHLAAIETSDVSLGVVHDIEVHRMKAAAETSQRAGAEALLKLRFEVKSVEDRTGLDAARAARAQAMENRAFQWAPSLQRCHCCDGTWHQGATIRPRRAA